MAFKFSSMLPGFSMLQAFADVGLESTQECSSAYFEMAKQPKTDRIIGIRRDLETLNYKQLDCLGMQFVSKY